MASAIQITVSEYLQTSYRPDCEYVDGKIQERNMGKREHARVQALLAAWFIAHETLWSVIALIEARTWVAPNRVRIPDVALTSLAPQGEVLTEAPILVVEILSPDDSYSDTEQRANEYLAMGVQAVWIIDPRTRTGRMCAGQSAEQLWTVAMRLEVSGTPIFVELDEIFRYIETTTP